MPTVREILATKGGQVLSISPEATALDAGLLMNDHKIGSLVVLELVPKLVQAGLEVVVQHGAGAAAGFADAAYQEKGARLEPEVLGQADVLLKVQPPTVAEVGQLKEGAVAVGLLAPYSNADGI